MVYFFTVGPVGIMGNADQVENVNKAWVFFFHYCFKKEFVGTGVDFALVQCFCTVYITLNSEESTENYSIVDILGWALTYWKGIWQRTWESWWT